MADSMDALVMSTQKPVRIATLKPLSENATAKKDLEPLLLQWYRPPMEGTTPV
jgi:hypothetical protein